MAAKPKPDPLRPAPIHKLTGPVRRFLQIEAMSGVVLLLATIALRPDAAVEMTDAALFAGTIIIIRPDSDDFNWALLLPLTLVATSAWFQLLTSKMAKTEDPMTMHLYTGWIGTLLASLVLPFVWTSLDSPVLWGGLLVMGLMGTVGHFMLILAYQRASAAILTPYLYGQIGFAMLGGWLVFSHIPDKWSLVGIAMIAVCGAVGAWLTAREARVVMERVET